MVNGPGDYVLTFGKHRGKRLDQIPAGYLTWCLEEMANLYPETRLAIEAFMTPPDLFDGGSPTEPPSSRPAPVLALSSSRSRQRRQAPRRHDPPSHGDGRATCSLCGLPGTLERPLIHARCRDEDEVPF